MISHCFFLFHFTWPLELSFAGLEPQSGPVQCSFQIWCHLQWGTEQTSHTEKAIHTEVSSQRYYPIAFVFQPICTCQHIFLGSQKCSPGHIIPMSLGWKCYILTTTIQQQQYCMFSQYCAALVVPLLWFRFIMSVRTLRSLLLSATQDISMSKLSAYCWTSAVVFRRRGSAFRV